MLHDLMPPGDTPHPTADDTVDRTAGGTVDLTADSGVDLPCGRRDRKKSATREALRSAALALVAERGFEHVTVEDIAEAVDVSPRTFFNHFSSKEEAIVGMSPEWLEQLLRVLSERPADEPPIETLRSVLGALVGKLAAHPEEWALRAVVLRNDPVLLARQLITYASFERTLATAVADRSGTTVGHDLYPTLAAAAAVAALRAAVGVWLEQGRTQPLTDLFEHAFDLLAGGLDGPTTQGGLPR